MKIPENYTCIEFSGLSLNPTFSIYLFEIFKHESPDNYTKHYYIGMTGDSHYPSARSIMHRLAGHIDLLKRSTQNQLIKGIKGLFHKTDEPLTRDELKKLDIKLHHWSIEGFVPWTGGMTNINKEDQLYLEYKNVQQKVATLENKIIHDFKDVLFNNTPGENSGFEQEYQYIHDHIRSLINTNHPGKKMMGLNRS